MEPIAEGDELFPAGDEGCQFYGIFIGFGA
jgi:hypothetical protein